MRLAVFRFARYTTVGVLTFAFDLALLYSAVSLLGLSYVIATPLAFLIGSTCGYVLNRRYVFKGTERRVHTGYAYFISVAIGGAAITTALVATLVAEFSLHYLVARTLAAGIVGMGNYLFNLHINFDVAGRHHS